MLLHLSHRLLAIKLPLVQNVNQQVATKFLSWKFMIKIVCCEKDFYLHSQFSKPFMGDGILCMTFITVQHTKWFSCNVAASRMVDHWISNQRAQSETSSPVQDTESISPSPAKKNLKIQTTVSKDKPRPISSQKTLSQRYVTFFLLYCQSWSGISPILKQWIYSSWILSAG